MNIILSLGGAFIVLMLAWAFLVFGLSARTSGAPQWVVGGSWVTGILLASASVTIFLQVMLHG